MLRLGAQVFCESKDPDEIARLHIKEGYRAAYCPDGLEIGDTSKIREFQEVFAKYDIVFSETWAWCNTLSLDQEEKKKNIAYVKERLALADELGALCCVNVMGSHGSPYFCGYHPDNFTEDFFAEAVDVAREIIDDVKPERAKMSYEIMPFTFLDGPEGYRRFIKAVDRKEMAIHLDPINCIGNVRQYDDNPHFLSQVIKELGSDVISYHLKDLWMRDFVGMPMFEEVLIGRGHIDYASMLKAIDEVPGEHCVMLEHLSNQDEYHQAADAVRNYASYVGVTILR